MAFDAIPSIIHHSKWNSPLIIEIQIMVLIEFDEEWTLEVKCFLVMKRGELTSTPSLLNLCMERVCHLHKGRGKNASLCPTHPSPLICPRFNGPPQDHQVVPHYLGTLSSTTKGLGHQGPVLMVADATSRQQGGCRVRKKKKRSGK